MTREIYQTRLTEPLLVALPVVAHVASGVALRLLRRWQNMRRYGGATPGMYALQRMRDADKTGPRHIWPALSYISVSGYAFSIFYGAHVFMNRVLPLLVGDSADVGLAYVAHGFARHAWLARTAYVGLIATGCGHMVWGMGKWLGVAPSTASWKDAVVERKVKRERRRKWMIVHGVTVAAAALWAVGGLGVVGSGGLADGWVAGVYDGLFARLGL